MQFTIDALMEKSGVRFGTSGARGLADNITDLVAYAYTKAFLQALGKDYTLGMTVAIAGDLRSSTSRIMIATAAAVRDSQGTPLNAGYIPSPAVAYYGFRNLCPTVMVTGSHIPEDRNGIKYTTAKGEITKEDEKSIRSQSVFIPDELFDEHGMFVDKQELGEESTDAVDLYRARYLEVFPHNMLSGVRIAYYEHSAVGRDIIPAIYEALGAEVLRVDRSEEFVPVDTEAIRDEDVAKAKRWAADERVTVMLSTDGDSDRPLVGDENGNWLRGDICGLITASFFGADTVALPVSCNTAVERCNKFAKVIRTRIGSPYVIEGMRCGQEQGGKAVCGYEANGGFLLGSDIEVNGKTLERLPTRDAIIVHLAVIGSALKLKQPISTLLSKIPLRVTASDRLTGFAQAKSVYVLDCLTNKPQIIAEHFGDLDEEIPPNNIDGLRFYLANGDIVHFRPSGNAPEFRCYAESDSEDRATQLVQRGLKLVMNLSE